MKPIISNDFQNIYTTIDFLLGERTKANSKITTGETVISVINSSGFANDNFMIIGEMGRERSEKVKIQSISGNDITLTAGVVRDYDNKIDISLLLYDKALLYKDTVLSSTNDIKNDYYTKISEAIVSASSYYIKFSNSVDSKTSLISEAVNGYERNLCGIADIYQLEDPANFSRKLLNKIDIASQEMRNKFTNQDQLFTDLSSNDIELLRLPTATLALYYAWFELIKDDKDIAIMKTKHYKELSDSKIEEVLNVISKGNDDIEIYGQTQMLR